MITFVTLLVLIQISLGASQLGCSFDITQLQPEPIIVTADDYQFIYPEPSAATSSVSVLPGKNIIISCPGGNLTLASVASGSTATATCVAGSTFLANGRNFEFNQIVCSKNPMSTARYTGKSCEANGKEIEIGFVLTPSIFKRLILVCFDDTTKNSLYAHCNITRSIEHREVNDARPDFSEGSFYLLSDKVNNLYGRAGQKATVNKLIGLPANSTKYIQDTSNFYLARGHLCAKADFLYYPQQTATFSYVNAAPQWQTFNSANWATAESNVQDYADNKGVDLQAYAGTYGVATLPHAETGEDTPLYLFVDSNGKKALPVPRLYFKVVYDPKNKQAVVLLGVNNPYQQNVTGSIICKDISSQITWLTWKATDLQAGYSYACDFNDFKLKVPYVPQLAVTGLLL